MKILLKVRRAWGAVRWKMLIIFIFFSVVSMILAGCLAVAILNVVVRRESAYVLRSESR